MKRTLTVLFVSITIIQYAIGQNNPNNRANGWYAIKNLKTGILDKTPIVTVCDFEPLRIDSGINSTGVKIYQIVGKVKKDKIQVWADATEKSIGKCIGFLYNGKIITSPQVNQRIESGNFAITTPGNDIKTIYKSICRERLDSIIKLYDKWIDSIISEMDKTTAKDFTNTLAQIYIIPFSPHIENIRTQYIMYEHAFEKEFKNISYSSRTSDYTKSRAYADYKKFIIHNPVSISFMIDGFLFTENHHGLSGLLIDDIVKSIYTGVNSIRTINFGKPDTI